MAKYKRMISTQFVNAGQFKLKLTNEAKLLYFYTMANADDKGFCDSVDENIIVFNNLAQTGGLVAQTYDIALKELLDKGYLYSFTDNYDNHIYLIRHWYIHNQIPKDRTTASNYEKYLNLVVLDENNVYQMLSKCQASAKQVPSKCDTSDKQLCTQIKLNKTKLNKNKIDIMSETNNIACMYTQEDNSLVSDNENKLEIPSSWDNETELVALNLVVKEKSGTKLTKEEEDYLIAYKVAHKK